MGLFSFTIMYEEESVICFCPDGTLTRHSGRKYPENIAGDNSGELAGRISNSNILLYRKSGKIHMVFF